MSVLLGCAEMDLVMEPDVEPEGLAAEALPPVNPNLATGRTYVLDTPSLVYTQPVGLDDLMTSLIDPFDTERAFTVLGTRRGQTLVRMGNVKSGPRGLRQDRCALTTDLVLQNGPGDLFGGQTPGPLAGTLNEIAHTYHDITMTGRLAPQARQIDHIRFAATLDVHTWTALGVGDVCQLIVLAGTTCTACPNGAPDCLDVAWEDGVATWDQALPALREVTAQSRAAAGCP